MISIVTAYHNRRAQLNNTAKSIAERSDPSKYELVIVDDASDEKVDEKYIRSLGINLVLHRIEKHEKKHINPCIPFNKAFRLARGDKLLIQNPENYHVWDMISHINSTLDENDYNIYSCLSLDWTQTSWLNEEKGLEKIELSMPKTKARFDGDYGWYIHPIYNQRPLHFMTAVHRKHVIEMQGFNEEFKDGTSYDDDEFAYRLSLKGLTFKLYEAPYCLHQRHVSVVERGLAIHAQKNYELYAKTLANKDWKVNKDQKWEL